MHTSAFVLSCLTLVNGAMASPASISSEIASSVDGASAGYPGTLNSTKPSAFYLAVASNNPLTNGKNVQLRPVVDQGSTGAQQMIVVLDATSPVLLGQLLDGVLCSFGKDRDNQLKDLGPTASLKVVKHTATSSLQEFVFVDNDKPTGGFSLDLLNDVALYGLYHNEKDLVVNGFILCEKENYQQIFYNTYKGNPPTYPGCEFIGLQTTVAPPRP